MASWLKVQRAIEHFESVKSTIAQDVASYGDRFTIETDGKETLDLLEPTPLISRYVGECVYQLRSTLDHLAFDLVKMNRDNRILPAKWEENCMFPIWENLGNGQTAPLPHGAFGNLPGIPVEAHTIIERVQPYHSTRTSSINTSLLLLNKLSNIDKHRRFALTRTRAKIRHRVVYKSGITGDSLNTLDHGAVIPAPEGWENDPIVDMERSIALTIAFDERDALGDASGVPIEYLLETMLNDVLGELYFPLNKLLG